MSNKILSGGQSAGLPKWQLDDLGKTDAAKDRAAPQALSRLRSAVPAPAPAAEGQAVDTAREQGYQEGLLVGRREAQAQADTERAQLHALASGLNELMRDFEQSLAGDVLALSLELTKLLVRQALRVKPELVVTVAREAIANLPGVDDQTVIWLHPADAALVKVIAEQDATLRLPWKITEDAQIERGGCRLETPTTEVDATLEMRWRRLVAALGRDDPWIDIDL